MKRSLITFPHPAIRLDRHIDPDGVRAMISAIFDTAMLDCDSILEWWDMANKKGVDRGFRLRMCKKISDRYDELAAFVRTETADSMLQVASIDADAYWCNLDIKRRRALRVAAEAEEYYERHNHHGDGPTGKDTTGG